MYVGNRRLPQNSANYLAHFFRFTGFIQYAPNLLLW
jgi:hypothetical protein